MGSSGGVGASKNALILVTETLLRLYSSFLVTEDDDDPRTLSPGTHTLAGHSRAIFNLNHQQLPQPHLKFATPKPFHFFDSITSPILWEQNTIIPRLPHTILIPGTTLSMQRSGMRSATSTGRVAFSAGVAEAGGSASKSENREIMVQHILVPEDQLKLLLELQHKIVKEGVDLSDLATEYSICSSKEEGGVLGWIRKGQMVQEFEEAAFSSPLNKLVRCKTKLGWHLLQVLAEREGGLLEDIEPEELYIKMQEQNFINEAQLMDVREPDEISIASLPGFKIYPLRQFGSWAPTITDNLDPMKDTYVLCHHGMRSLQVAKWLQTQGFKRIYNVSGGIHAYSQKVDASIPTY